MFRNVTSIYSGHRATSESSGLWVLCVSGVRKPREDDRGYSVSTVHGRTGMEEDVNYIIRATSKTSHRNQIVLSASEVEPEWEFYSEPCIEIPRLRRLSCLDAELNLIKSNE